MATTTTRFSFRPGLPSNPFTNVRLAGSWDAGGRSSPTWSVQPMAPAIDPDGCPSYEAMVAFDRTRHLGDRERSR